MAVTRKPKPRDVDEFIANGGSVPPTVVPTSDSFPAGPASEPAADTEEVKGLKLRLPVSLLKRVDEAVASRRPAPSRHQWILEAIYEKLDRELDASE